MSAAAPRLASVSDTRLVAAAQHGDQHAYAALLQRYDSKLAAIVSALRLPPGAETHDVLQAARLGLAAAIESWHPGAAPFSAYAKMCARHRAITAIDQARTARRRVLADAASLDALADAGREPATTQPTNDPYRVAVAREELAAIIAALPRLSTRETICVNGWLNGRAYHEIAEALGSTKKAVALSVRRGRDKLAAAADRK